MQVPAINYPRIVFYVWNFVCLYLGISLAAKVTSGGIREMGPAFAARLVGLRGFDIATLCALVLVAGAFFCVDRALRDYLFENPVHDPAFSSDKHRGFIRTVGWGVIVLDTIFFYCGMANLNSWYATSKTGPILLTALYVLMICVMSYISILLWLKAEREQQ